MHRHLNHFKGKPVIALVALLGIVLITAGATYAWFSYSKSGTKEHTISAGSIMFHYKESSQGLTLDDAMPMTDSQGMAQTDYFDFTITSNTSSTVDIPYYITARRSGTGTNMDNVVKVYLTKVNSNNVEIPVEIVTGKQIAKVSELGSYINNQGINIPATEKSLYNDKVWAGTENYTQKYRLRMWIDNDAQFIVQQEGQPDQYPYEGKTYTLTVNVYSTGIDVASEQGISFATDSWSTIISNVRNNGGTLYSPNGNGKDSQVLRPIKLVLNGREETHYLRVANTTSCEAAKVDNPNLTSETACGFVIEFADILSMQQMNTDHTSNGGYPGTDVMYDYVTNTVYNALPSELKSLIVNTTVVSSHGTGDATCDSTLDTRDENCNFITPNQKLYLLDKYEVYGEAEYDTAATTTRQLDYYAMNNSDAERLKTFRENGTDTISSWWLRTARSNVNRSFNGVKYTGVCLINQADAVYGVSPAFRIG